MFLDFKIEDFLFYWLFLKIWVFIVLYNNVKLYKSKKNKNKKYLFYGLMVWFDILFLF